MAEENYYPEAVLKTYKGADRVVSSEEVRAILAARAGNELVLKTGLPSLDEAIGGLEGGELIIVSGKTKHGKTTLCQTVTHNLFEAGTSCLWFSYEVPQRQFMSQMDEADRFYLPLTLPKHSMEWILDRVVESMFKHRTDVVFIDHLHFLIDMARIKNPVLEIGSIVRTLKLFAIELNIVIFLVSHVRNIPKGEDATEDDLRDSGFTKAEADSTWIVSRLARKDELTKELIYSNQARLTVCNHRRTGVMGRRIVLAKTGKYFEEDVRINSTEDYNANGNNGNDASDWNRPGNGSARGDSKPRQDQPIDGSGDREAALPGI